MLSVVSRTAQHPHISPCRFCLVAMDWTLRALLTALLCCQWAVGCTGHDLEIDWSEFSSEIDAIGCEGTRQKWTCAGLFPLSAADADSSPVPWNSSLVVSPNDMSDYDFVRACHCDDQCVEYGDCCRDADALWSASKGQRRQRFHCLPLAVASNQWTPTDPANKWSVYMVGECPDQDTQLADMCHRHPIDDEHYTYMLDVPVLSLRTNLTYANIFCAQCHQDADQLTPWDVRIECKIDAIDEFNTTTIVNDTKDLLSKLTYVKGERRWRLSDKWRAPDWSDATCVLTIQQFADPALYVQTTASRRCIGRIESCAPWASAVDRIKCRSYTRLTQTSSSGLVYKNPHCARCNYGAQHSSLDCFELNANQHRSPVRPASRRGPTHSMSLIFDFTLGGGGGGGGDGDGGDGGDGGGRVGQQRRCGANEIWDHVHEQCHAVVCADLYERRGSSCVARRGQAVDCPRIQLLADDFHVDPDGLLVLNASGRTYNDSQYEVVNDTVFICAELDYYFKYSAAQDYLSTVCLSVSVFCLALHLAIHLLLPQLRNLPGKNLLSLSAALFGAQLLFVSGVKETQLGRLCAGIGVLTHWFFLGSFFWMNVMGLDICRTFSSRLHRTGSGRLTFGRYSLYAWGSATLIVAAALVTHLAWPESAFSPKYGAHVCWISNRKALSVFFALPVAALLLANTGLFGCTVLSIVRQKRSAKFAVDQSYGKQSQACDLMARRSDRKSRQHKIRFVLYIKLALIMGLGWLFAFLASATGVQALWYPFILCNGLQGLFILLAFDLKMKVFYLMWQRLTGRPHPSVSQSTGKTTTTSSISYLVRSSIVTGGDLVSGQSSGSNRQSLLSSHASPSVR